MAEKIVAYKPKCCNKAMVSKSSALRHERNCLHNQDNKTCLSCKYMREDSNTIYNSFHNGNPGSTDYEQYYKYCGYDEDKGMDKIFTFYDGENVPKWNCENYENKNHCK